MARRNVQGNTAAYWRQIQPTTNGPQFRLLPAFRIYGPSVKWVLIKRKVETRLSEEYSNGFKMQTKSSGKH